MSINISEVAGIMIVSLSLGVRFVPVISLSELLGGRFTPLMVKSSLVAILGFFRYFTSDRSFICQSIDIGFIVSEFLLGFLIAAPFIILTKFIINSSSVVENLFGSMGVLNSQGIFDERSSVLEMIFEMIVILIIFSSDSHLFLLKLLLGTTDLSFGQEIIRQMTYGIISNLNLISKNGLGYFGPVIFIALSLTVIFAFADLTGGNLNISSNTLFINTIVIIGGIIIMLKKICLYIQIDIFRIRNLAETIQNLFN